MKYVILEKAKHSITPRRTVRLGKQKSNKQARLQSKISIKAPVAKPPNTKIKKREGGTAVQPGQMF